MTDKYGKSPLTLAQEKGYDEIVALLASRAHSIGRRLRHRWSGIRYGEYTG